MKRYGILLTLLLIIGLFLTPTALAAGNQWSLTWHYDGSLTEVLLVPETLPEQIPEIKELTAGNGWKQTQEGANIKYSRDFASWKQYETAPNSLPLTLDAVDYIVLTMVEIHPAPDMAAGNEILQALDKAGGVEITITMPNEIKQSSGQIIDESSVRFTMQSFGDPAFTARPLVYSRWFQWFEMGITIMIVGTLAIIIWLSVRMRKIDRLIEEEYSLEKVEAEILGGGEETGQGEKDSKEK